MAQPTNFISPSDQAKHFVQEGTADMRKAWEFLPKQIEINNSDSPYRLHVGGIRSGKTAGALMFGVFHYMLRYPGCKMLVLRRTLNELKEGAIADFHAHVPKELYTWVWSPHPQATFYNGSKIIFGHCTHNKQRDIEQYLGTAYPFILLDECGQFSKEAWDYITSRNTTNPECQPCNIQGDPDFGKFPVPQAWGCTNPVGEYWDFYKTVFKDKRPYDPPEGTVGPDENGYYWVMEAGEWRCVYDPTDYYIEHSTVLDNPHELRRDPGIIERLNGKPKALRDRMLFGYMDTVAGAFYDCWDDGYHKINPREKSEDGDPMIIWEPWQPVWAGWDWGMAHWNTVYLFTRAQVRQLDGTYRRKVVCFKEVVEKGKTADEMCTILSQRCKKHPAIQICPTCDAKNQETCPHATLRVEVVYFSHEKFNRTGVEAHTPAAELSTRLRKIGWPPVSMASKDRIGGATLIYTMLKHGDLAVLDSCPEICRALPQVMRDKDNLEDVSKPDGANKADDCYDGFRYGLFGYLGQRMLPEAEQRRRDSAAIQDPWARRVYEYKAIKDAEAKKKAHATRLRGNPAPWANRLRDS